MDVASLNSTSATQDVQTTQKHHGQKPDTNKFLEELTKNLNLTSDQASQIKTILDQNAPDASKSSANGTTPTQPPDKSKMDELNSKIENVLTDSQKTQFESFIQKLQQNRPAPPTGFQLDATQQSQQAATSSASTSADAILNAINTTGAVANSTTDNAIDYYA